VTLIIGDEPPTTARTLVHRAVSGFVKGVGTALEDEKSTWVSRMTLSVAYASAINARAQELTDQGMSTAQRDAEIAHYQKNERWSKRLMYRRYKTAAWKLGTPKRGRLMHRKTLLYALGVLDDAVGILDDIKSDCPV